MDPASYGTWKAEGVFLGFSLDKNLSGAHILISDQETTLWIAAGDVKSFYTRGNRVPGPALEEHLASGTVPFNSGLVISATGADTLVAVNDIDALQRPNRKNLKWSGLAIGALIDAVIIVGVAAQGGVRVFGH